MKNSIITAIIAFVAVPLACNAQKYVPRDQWPFIYEDFSRAEILLPGGERTVLESANVCVSDAKVYFVEKDTLKVSTRIVSAVRLNGDDFVLSKGRLMKVLRRTEHGFVLLDTEVNHEAMTRADVGYGFKSSVSATEKRSFFEGSNGSTLSLRMVQNPIQSLEARKNTGEELVLKQTKYVLVNGAYPIRAIKTDVRSAPGVDKKALDSFWKQNKVKYSDDDSLAALVEFLYGER